MTLAVFMMLAISDNTTRGEAEAIRITIAWMAALHALH